MELNRSNFTFPLLPPQSVVVLDALCPRYKDKGKQRDEIRNLALYKKGIKWWQIRRVLRWCRHTGLKHLKKILMTSFPALLATLFQPNKSSPPTFVKEPSKVFSLFLDPTLRNPPTIWGLPSLPHFKESLLLSSAVCH